MADKLIQGAGYSATELTNAPFGVYWSSPLIGVVVLLNSSIDVIYQRTVDAGANWSSPTVIHTGTCTKIAVWYDQQTPNDTGTLLHIVWTETVAADDLYYRTVDISADTMGTKRIIESSITLGNVSSRDRLTITKTRSGNLGVAISTSADKKFYISTDSGVNWITKADVIETGAADDWIILTCANTTDDDDMACIFWDGSSNELSIKIYDASLDSWTETLISTGMVDYPFLIDMDVSVRHSDGHLIVVAMNAHDASLADFKVWDINPTPVNNPTITAKTDIFTDQIDSIQASLIINQQNDYIYIGYFKGGVVFSSVDVVYKLSTDGAGTWGTDSVFSTNTADDYRGIGGAGSITNAGGRIMWTWFNQDLSDILTNISNDIKIDTVIPSARRIFNIS